MYLLLGSPTRTHVCSLFSGEGEIVAHAVWNVPEGEQTDLAERVDVLLRDASVSYEDLEGIVSLTGPGSFSFSRTGVVVANTLQFAHAIPLVGIDLLQWGVLVARAQHEEASQRVISAVPTLHESWFVGEGVVGQEGLPELSYERVTQDELVRRAEQAVVVAQDHPSSTYQLHVYEEEQLKRIVPQLVQLPFQHQTIEPRYIVEPNIGSPKPKT